MIKRIKLIAVIISTLVFNSCDKVQTNLIEFDYNRFTSEKLAWETSNIQNYSYEYYSSGFTFEHVKIYVENGKYLRSDSLDNSFIGEYKKSITDIYNNIEQRYIQENSQERSSTDFYLIKIDIEYDTIYHIITSVDYDYYIPENIAVDGNFGFSILNFTIE